MTRSRAGVTPAPRNGTGAKHGDLLAGTLGDRIITFLSPIGRLHSAELISRGRRGSGIDFAAR